MLAAPARAIPAPGSAQRAALQDRIGRLSRVQILGPSGATLLLKPVVRDDGLHMREPYSAPRQALIEIGDVPQPPPPVSFVSWSEIDAVQAPVRAFRSGVVTGVVLSSLIVGATLFSFRRPFMDDWDRHRGTVLVGTPLLIGTGALAGGLLFALLGEDWQTVYPVRTARK